MATAKKLRYALDEDQHTASWETGADVEYEEVSQVGVEDIVDVDYGVEADPDYDDTEQAEYEEVADPDYGDEVVGEVVAVEAEPIVLAPPAAPQSGEGFTYELGRAVLPVTQQQPRPVVWRGYLKERHPITGLVQRVPVYWLDDGFWDCYREDELQVA